MQMYPKKLEDLDALHRERFRLKVQIRALEDQGFWDLDPGGTAFGKGMGWASTLLGKKGWREWILPLAPPLLSWVTRSARKRLGRKLVIQLSTLAGIWIAFRFLKRKFSKD